MTRIDHRQLHPAIGTEVLGIDLSRPLEAEAAAQMVKLWEERSVLLFRGQDLSDEDQIRATGYFGRVRDVEFKDLAERKHNGTHPAVAIISNIVSRSWHRTSTS